MGRRCQRKSPGLATAAVLLALIVASVAIAQTQERFIGTVQWIDGERIGLALDSRGSVPIDLTDVDQSAYQTLGPGDRAIVMGTRSPDRDRVMATSISPASN